MSSVDTGLGILKQLFNETMRSLPDSLFLGSSMFALLTQNFPISILVLAMFEFSIVAWLLFKFVGSLELNTESVVSDLCLPGIPSPYLISFLGYIFPKASFPSIPIFFISSSLFYIVFSVLNFRDELKELGRTTPEWKIRIPLSIIFTTVLLLCFIFWRVINSCDSLWVSLGSLLFGLIAGGSIQLLHTYLFGRDSINFLGIPLLADKSVTGGKQYICAKHT
jgi:hypothetical protein